MKYSCMYSSLAGAYACEMYVLAGWHVSGHLGCKAPQSANDALLGGLHSSIDGFPLPLLRAGVQVRSSGKDSEHQHSPCTRRAAQPCFSSP